MSKDFREVGGRDSPALCILFSNGIFAGKKKKVSFHEVTKAMFTSYVFRNGRRLQTAASRPRSTKNLSSDGSSPIFRIDVFTCKYVATLLTTLGSFQWLRFNSTFQESEISNVSFISGNSLIKPVIMNLKRSMEKLLRRQAHTRFAWLRGTYIYYT